MAKLSVEFEITYPLKNKVIRDLKIVTEHVADLKVTGTAYCDPSILKTELHDRFAVDIDFIRFNGTDIKPILDSIGSSEEIREYTLKQVPRLFTETKGRQIE